MTPIEQAKRLIDEAHASPDRWENKYAAAQRLLEEALQSSPEDTDLLICFGAVLSDRGRHREAVPVLEQAISLGSSDRNAYLNLAIALMNCDANGRGQAEAFFKKPEICNQEFERGKRILIHMQPELER